MRGKLFLLAVFLLVFIAVTESKRKGHRNVNQRNHQQRRQLQTRNSQAGGRSVSLTIFAILFQFLYICKYHLNSPGVIFNVALIFMQKRTLI